jgi:hypothetical protein
MPIATPMSQTRQFDASKIFKHETCSLPGFSFLELLNLEPLNAILSRILYPATRIQ